MQGDLVRKLKEDGAPELDVKKAVQELKARKQKLEQREVELLPKEELVDRVKMEDLLRRRFFYVQSFEIYGGVTGLYDYGPIGCGVKANMLAEWRKHFVLEENMLEVDCSILTPEPVLKVACRRLNSFEMHLLQASGHVERFSDYMVKDVETGDCYRADHLIKQVAEKLCDSKNTPTHVKEELKNICAMVRVALLIVLFSHVHLCCSSMDIRRRRWMQ